MTTSDLVNNFVSQFNKPFDLSMISNMIDREADEVREVLTVLLNAERIRLVDPEQGIYVRNNRYLTSVCYHQKGNWQFDPIAANALLDHIEKGKYFTIREVAKDFPRSRQWVYVYLEALASIGILSYSADGYKVETRDNLKDIGKKVIKGAINQIYNDYYSKSSDSNRPYTPYTPKPVDPEKLRLRQEKAEKKKAEAKAARKARREEWERLHPGQSRRSTVSIWPKRK